MRISWKSVSVVPVLGIALVLSSCSGDQSGFITNPSSNLSRRAPLTYKDKPVLSCQVTALDYFGDGGAMPFTVSCEDMGDATVQVSSEEYNGAGCMIGVRGTVSFPNTSGHSYQFTAATGDCQHDGGKLKVCSTQLEGCIEVPLPRLQTIRPNRGHSL